MAARRPLLRNGAALALSGLVLAGCDLLPAVGQMPPPPARPTQAAAPPVPPDEESRAIAEHFARVEANLKAQGLLRTDGGGRDTPFSSRDLAENFLKIALYDEYTESGGALIARETRSTLRRWEEPIRMQVDFGPSVPAVQRGKDVGDVAVYTERLSRLTRLPIRLAETGVNFHVFVVSENERRALGPRLRQIVPGIDDTAVSGITDLPLATFCVVYAFSTGDGSGYSRAVAIIRAEHPPALRLSCIHEELAQGLGLANDSPAARPSIFNDDEEFGLLTRQDELMLRMLYDPRLRLGMSEAEARPVVEAIARELMGGES